MRGSPLVRTLLVLIALVMTALGLAALTKPAERPTLHFAAEPDEPGDRIPTPFVLTLSAAATSVTLESSGEILSFEPDGPILAGTLPLESGHPSIFIDVTWRDDDSAPRFAKLVIEPPGHPTQTQVFDGIGPLSDVWEPHVHH